MCNIVRMNHALSKFHEVGEGVVKCVIQKYVLLQP